MESWILASFPWERVRCLSFFLGISAQCLQPLDNTSKKPGFSNSFDNHLLSLRRKGSVEKFIKMFCAEASDWEPCFPPWNEGC